MKHILSILFLLTIGFTACQRNTTYPLAMQQAEELMKTRPDSALHLLEDMADSLIMLSNEAQMYYHLLTIQAKDKQYITHTSDSLINRIVSYYEESGDKERLMMAYYYQGSTYRDMNDAPRALKAFHQAIDASKGAKDLTLLGQTYGQMGTLLSYQELYDEALDAKQHALKLYMRQNDSTRFPYLNRDIARIYSAKRKNDSALYYYGLAYQYAKDMKLSRQQYSILSELGCLHFKIGDVETAKRLLQQSLKEGREMPNALYKLGLIYRQSEQTDSAYYYLKASMKEGDIGIRCYAYLYLSELEKDKKQSLEYKKMHEILEDSLAAITQRERTGKLHLLYSFQRAEKDNDALRLQNEQKQSQIYLLALAFLIALFFIFICFVYAKKKKLEILIQAEKFRKHNAFQQALNTASIKKNEEQINQLEIDLRSLKTQKNTLHHQLLTTQKELLELTNRHCETIQKKRKIQDTIFYGTAICKHFRQAEIGKAIISGEDWDTLQNTIEAYYPLFIKNIKELCPSMSDREFKICLMIKTAISVKGISNILKCDPTAISKTRKRLHAKITGTEGNSKDLDKLLSDL